MEAREAIKALVDSINEKDDELFFPLLSERCVYFSRGKERARGKEAVCETLRVISEHWHRKYRHAWEAAITESGKAAFRTGAPCAVIAMTDAYSCAGYFTLEMDGAGKVDTLIFDVDPSVRFAAEGGEDTDCIHTGFPANAAEAVLVRAAGSGLIGTDPPGLHFPKTAYGREFAERLYDYFEKYVFESFEDKLRNAAGYMFTAGMTFDFTLRTGIPLLPFNEAVANEGGAPIVIKQYQDWVSKGYESGRDLYTAFKEYRSNCSEDRFDTEAELIAALHGIFTAGQIKADADIDGGMLQVHSEDAAVNSLVGIGVDEGVLEPMESFEYIFPVLNRSAEVALQVLEALKDYGQKHIHPYRIIIRNSLVFSAYAGIGAVLLWRENGEELPEGSIVEILCRERGLYYMDEHVHDLLGMPYETEEAQALAQHLFLLRDVLIALIEDTGYHPIQIVEYCKAMYDYGMLWTMKHLGIGCRPRVFGS